MRGVLLKARRPAGAGTPTANVGRAKRLTLLACILGSSAVFLDGTLVNVES